ncbi:MAG: signal recognition particle-docking protein FtsY [Candidatus Woesearchaeota archaeon]
MFGFLKDKLKSLVSKFTKKVETEAKEEIVEIEKEAKKHVKEVKKAEKPAKKPIKEEKPKVVEKKPESKAKKPKAGEKKPEVAPKVEVAEPKVMPEKPRIEERKAEVLKAEVEKPKVEEKKAEVSVPKVEEEKVVEEKKGFFARIKEAITTKKISEKQFDEMFWEMELALLENNAAVEVIEKIKSDLKSELVEKPIPRGRVEDTIVSSLRRSISDLFPVEPPDLLKMVGKKKPFVICFVGVNGSGKTTSIAKVAHLLKQNGYSVVLAAADTFRAAAIDQLQLHADKLGVKLIRHDYGSDPAAVAFDAIKHAEATKKDVVLIDTAGRLHSNTNLMDEMKKIMRVAKPDLKLFVGESITGNDCIEQARQFDNAIGIDGIILAKADVDEKGGAAISVSYVTKKPILYLGVGQEYADLQAFDKDKLIASIGL